MELTNGVKRTITGTILTLILIIVWYYGSYMLLGFCILTCLAAQYEFFNLFFQKSEAKLAKAIGFCFCAIFLAGVYFGGAEVGLGIFRTSLLTIAMFCVFKINSPLPAEVLKQAALVMASISYIPLALSPILILTPAEQVFVVLIAPISDTAAYFFGVRYGKHKIFPKISPKKSLEGAVAGLCAATLFALLFSLITSQPNHALYALGGFALGIMAQLGDFFESGLKRIQGVKDSGDILPGHGGVLDRIDSILFVVPAYAFIHTLIKLFG